MTTLTTLTTLTTSTTERSVAHRVRKRTLWLVAGCDLEAMTKQHSPLMSPLVWDLAHIAVQEEIWFQPVSTLPQELRDLYDAFKQPRAGRVDLPLLTAEESVALLARISAMTTEADAFTVAMVAQHEAQHAETMTATLALRVGPPVLVPVIPANWQPMLERARDGQPRRENACEVPGGPFVLGTTLADDPTSLDNERPAHVVDVPSFAIDRHPVTVARWRAFMADGGYDREELWSPAGWQHRTEACLVAPLFWAGEHVQRFGRLEPLRDDEPVEHVGCYEAEAFCRWAGGRLPTEQEWEKAASWDPATGTKRRWPWGDADPDETTANLGGRALRPAPVGSLPASASAYGVEQLIGDVWEWTSSTLALWPGFEPMVYADYTVPFVGPDHQVLRGGSWAVDPVAVRPTFRNWDYPVRRQIFAGVRVAYDRQA